MRVETLRVTERARISSTTAGQGNGGSINIRAGEVELREFSSGIFAETGFRDTGSAGNIDLHADRLQVTEGARISSTTVSQGNGGSINIQVNEVELSGFSGGILAETASAGNAGPITLQVSETLRITEDAEISTTTFGQGNGASIVIQANNIELSGFSAGILAETKSRATGNAGDIDLQVTETLRVTEGAEINNTTSGQGDGGNIVIRANDVELSGLTSGIFAETSSGPDRTAGSIDLQVAETLKVTERAQISSTTSGQADGGRINIRANDVELSGFRSGVLAETINGTGNGGLINLQAETLQATEAAQISSATFGQGNSGNVVIDVDSLGLETGAQISSATFGQGNGGNVVIDVDNLSLETGAQISSAAFRQGDGGSLQIRANEIALTGISEFSTRSGIITSTRPGSEGAAGRIDLQVDTLQVTEGAQISSATAGQGDGNSVSIRANAIEVSGVALSNQLLPSEIVASAEPGSGGSAGSIDITVEDLQVTDTGRISVNDLGGGNASDLNIVANLNIMADRVLLTDNGVLTAEVTAGDQGNIVLLADSFLLMRRGALISANATNQATGGNITIEAPVILGLENSDIVANAVEGDGGRINISTQALLGLQFRDFRTPESDITASSQFGLDGIVQIETPDIDPNQGLVELPSALNDPSNQIATGCLTEADNTFIVTGRSGLSDAPGALNSSAVWEDWRPLETEESITATTVPETVTYIPLREATDIVTHVSGQVELVASNEAYISVPEESCGIEN